MKRLTLAVLFFATIFWTSGGFNNVLAQQNLKTDQEEASDSAIDWSSLTIDPGALDVGDSLIAPNSALYFLKSIREYFELALASNDYVKAQRELEFSVRRLREVKSLIEVKREDLIEQTLENYRNNLFFVEKVFKNDIDVGISVARHLFVLETLYNQTSQQDAKRMIRASMVQAFNFNKDLLASVKDPELKQKVLDNVSLRQVAACKFLDQESRSGDLNETEKAVLKEIAQDCQQVIKEGFLNQFN